MDLSGSSSPLRTIWTGLKVVLATLKLRIIVRDSFSSQSGLIQMLHYFDVMSFYFTPGMDLLKCMM